MKIYKSKKIILFIFCFPLFSFINLGCGSHGLEFLDSDPFNIVSTEGSELPPKAPYDPSADDPEEIPADHQETEGTESVPDSTPVTYKPVLWEAKRSEGKMWTQFTLGLINKYLKPSLLQGSRDIENFCPKYYQLSEADQIHFWAYLVSAMTKYESGFNPLSRLKETTMGIDPITGQQVYSEGLLQLSYQDTRWAPYCEFDWKKDKALSPADPKKTILNPYKNINCGLRILARQVRKNNLIAAPPGKNYWSVLIPGGKYSRLSYIQELTRQKDGCR